VSAFANKDNKNGKHPDDPDPQDKPLIKTILAQRDDDQLNTDNPKDELNAWQPIIKTEDPPKRQLTSIEHVKRMSDEYGVDIGLLGSYLYPRGWFRVVDDLFYDLRGADLVITDVREDIGRLVVQFNTEDPEAELRAWRAINRASAEARCACEDCGIRGRFGVHGKNKRIGVLCADCLKKQEPEKAEPTRTGTWLDYF
jgi:hypothetical protein